MQLDTPLTKTGRLAEQQVKALRKLGVVTVGDMLYHFPARYGDISEMKNIGLLIAGETAVIFGKITNLKAAKTFKSKMTMATATVTDESGRIQCVWFNQPYLAKMTPEGALVRIEGKVSERRKKNLADKDKAAELYFSNPKLEIVNSLPTGVGDSLFTSASTESGREADANATVHNLYPVYPESRGITSNWMYHKIIDIFKSGILDTLVDPIPEDMLKKYNLPGLKTALIWAHTPTKLTLAESARKRFAFEEIFFIQLEKQLARREYEQNPAWKIEARIDEKIKGMGSVVDFIKHFPFAATEAQMKAVEAIMRDFNEGHAMARLLEGDVGSGKTAVAAAATYAIVADRKKQLQVAYMCPTEILATQHFESFINYFAYLGIQIGLITGNGCRKFPSKINPKGWTDISRAQLLKWVADGEIHVLIGTHALIQKGVKFKNLALAIIDEQHRFGTNQRAELIRKEAAPKTGKTLGSRTDAPATVADPGETEQSGAGISPLSATAQIVPIKPKMPVPHLLSMTATPIPRTLALTIYGDLDLTLLDQMPSGRKPIITEIVTPDKRESTYEKIRLELVAGRQAYIICPRIDEPDPTKEMAVAAKSVIEEAKRLKERVFPEYEIGILHSKMKPEEKEKTMLDFKSGAVDILCATSVVEVGVNVPNATIIVIEGSERFGLAQLHQLRGRVIRGNHQAYCYTFTGDGTTAHKPSDKTIERLKALTTAKNGFELAEYDLQLRGAGALSGGKQWGISDIAMEALKNIKMVEAARTEAHDIIVIDPSFANFPVVGAHLTSRKKDKSTPHFE
jgi:ATP-dependent DNA helicase RecG